MVEALRRSKFGRHPPPPGLAFGEPDDRLQPGIQYAAAYRFIAGVSGILDRPVIPDQVGDRRRAMTVVNEQGTPAHDGS